MLDELRQIAIFAKTVDHGSFRAAAKALDLSPSVVSHHVGQLEQRLDTALLYRSTRKLSLTPDGERLLTAAHAMMSAAEAGLQDIVSHTEQPSGTLRVTAPAFLAQSDLSDQVAYFSIAYPKVSLTIDFSDMRKELIADGYDIAVRAGEMEDSSLMARKLFDVRRKLIASPDYLANHTAPLNSPDDLSELDWLVLAPVKRQKYVFTYGNKKKSLTRHTSRIAVNNVYALSHLAKKGAGLAIVPDFVAADALEAGDLMHLLPEWEVQSFPVYAVWPANVPKYGLVKHFTGFIADHSRN